jgi:DNA invertase Pin-like site-specific DNA recombinase
MTATKLKTGAKTPPETRRLGYARVSTNGQALYTQLAQLRKAGCTKIHREKATGARPDRRALIKLLEALALGDVLTVTRIDRLARSTFDLFSILKHIVDKGGQFRSLAEPWADTATSTGRLMIAVLGGLADVERDLIRTRTAEGRSRAKARGRLMLTVLGGLAEFERELIRARTSKGRERAKARGQSLGRPFKLTPHQRSEAIRRRDRGEPLSDIARSYNVHPSTISRLTA